jgi:hypothetical protein
MPSSSPPTTDASHPTARIRGPHATYNVGPRVEVPAVSIFFAFFLVILAGCAGQVAPSGGPPDTIPPKVVFTDPDTNSVRFGRNSITLEFSEYVDRRSVQDAIFISPSVGELEYDWSGTEVTLRFEDTLRHNTTYVVTVGTDVRDLRAGNRMASAFTLAFSTGDSIDRGSVAGRVFSEKPEGIMIFAYRLDGIRADTLNPSHTKPDYITQTGTNGWFSLVHLRLGAYRLFAVSDEYRNLLYDRQVDAYGVLRSDLLLTPSDTALTKYWFRMSREDTAKPFIAGAKAIDSRRIALRLSEPADSASLAQSVIQIADTVHGRPVGIVSWIVDPDRPASITLFTAAALDSPAFYRIRIAGIVDTAGNAMDEKGGTSMFEGILTPDTLKRAVSVAALRDSTKGVEQDVTPEVRLAVPVESNRILSAITLADSSKKPVRAEVVRLGPASFRLQPQNELMSRAWYTLRVRVDSLADVLGGAYPDTTIRIRFQTADARTSGTLSGDVVDETADSGKIVILATRIDPAPKKVVRQVVARPGPFVFDQLPEGKYALEAYRDRRGKGAYFGGRPYPFLPSERFTASADTIRVRARWKVEGAQLKFTGK